MQNDEIKIVKKFDAGEDADFRYTIRVRCQEFAISEEEDLVSLIEKMFKFKHCVDFVVTKCHTEHQFGTTSWHINIKNEEFYTLFALAFK